MSAPQVADDSVATVIAEMRGRQTRSKFTSLTLRAWADRLEALSAQPQPDSLQMAGDVWRDDDGAPTNPELQPQPASDAGPWQAVGDGHRIESRDFVHDVALDISGDFSTDTERLAYVNALCAKLNTAPQPAITPVGVEKFESRLRGRAGPFTAQPGERYVDADIALTVLREALAQQPRPDDGEAVDGCTESNCPRCQTAPHARGDMRHAGIGTRPDDGEAAAWRYRHPSIDSPSGWHRWIVSNEKPCKKYHDSEYQPLYAHPAPADVARLVDVDEAMVERALSAPYGRFAVSSFIPLKSPANLRAHMRAALTAALAPFTAARQEAE